MSRQEAQERGASVPGNEPPGLTGHPPAAVGDRVEAIAGAFLGRLLAGEEADLRGTIATHPDLAPWLERRLVLIQGLRTSFAREAETGPAFIPCPHCGRRNEVIVRGEQATACDSCGRSFHVEPGGPAADSGRELPERIGRFEVLRFLGQGAFGAVYEGRDPELDRPVALKVPRSGRFSTQADEERFLREARSAASLKHPGIVSLYEVGEQDGVPFLVYELIVGQPLNELLARGRLSYRESAALGLQVAEALAEAHRLGVIHRDIKPANILVDSAGRPHLMDFGLARRDEDDLTVTLDGQILGTPAYMAPEQAAGEREKLGPWSDVYGLGAVLYELITGQQLFHGSRSMVIHHVLHEEPAQPSSLQGDVPRDLETICLKALAKAPERRYAGAGAMASDLRCFLAGQPIAARPVSRAERLASWARRNPLVAGLTAAIFLLLLAAACGSTVALLHYREQRDALDKKHQEALAAQEATARALRRSIEQASQVTVEKATQWMVRWDCYHGLPWLAKAIEMSRDVPEVERAHRVRFGTALRGCSRVAQMAFHGDAVTVARISPDGSWCLTGSQDGTLRVWEVETGAPVSLALDAGSKVLDAVFSPEGDLVAALTEAGLARIWAAGTGEEDAAPLAVGDCLPRLLFSPAGDELLLVSRSGAARLWRWKDGAERLTIEPPSPAISFDLSADGSAILTGSLNGSARAWDAVTGALLAERVHGKAVRHVLSSPVDRRLVSIGEDGEAAVWRLDTGEAVGEPLAQGGPVVRAAWSPDGAHLATATADGKLRVWHLDRGETVLGPQQQGTSVTSLAFSPDGRWLASSGNDFYVRVWNLHTKKAEVNALLHGNLPLALAFHPDGRRLLSGAQDHAARLWDLAGWNDAEARVWHSRALTAAELSPDGARFVTAGQDNRLRVWDAATGRPLTPWLHSGATPLDIEHSPDGSRIAACGRLGRATVWDAVTGEKLGETLDHGQLVPALGFSPDGRRLATVDHGGKCRVFEASTLHPALGPLDHGAPLNVVAFALGGTRVATGGKDGTVCLWDAESGERVRTLRESGSVWAMDISRDGRLLALGTSAGIASTWDATTGEPAGAPIRLSAGMSAVRLGKGGRWLAAVSRDNTARVWETSTGTPVTAQLYEGRPTHIAFGPGDRLVAVGSRDGGISLLDTATSTSSVARLSVDAAVVSLQIGKDGERLLVASQNGEARILDLRPDLRPFDETRLLARVVSSRILDATESLPCALPEELREAWTALRAKHPKGLGAEPQKAAEWHYRQALASEAGEQWPGALFHCARALELDPLHALARELNDRAAVYQVLPAGWLRPLRRALPR